MKITWFILLSCLSVTMINGQKKKSSETIDCNDESRKKADLCAEKLWFTGRNSRKFPESDQQMQKHCKQTLNLIKCTKDYTDSCAKGVQKQLANVLLYTQKMNQKSYCSKANKRDEVVQFASCGNAVKDEASKCLDHFLDDLGRAKAVKETKLRVPFACCAFHKHKECIMTAARQKGSPDCMEKKMDLYARYIDSMAGNTLNLMCTDYEEDSDKCSRLPAGPKKYEKPNSIMLGFGQLVLGL